MQCKTVLCPIDFSNASYEALRTAGDMAKHFSASLTVVHVIFRIPAMYGMEGLMPEFDISSHEKNLGIMARDQLEKEVPKRIAAGLSPRLLTLYGDPAQQIVATADKEGSDLIVIATHGMTGWRHYAFGSVAQKVIQYTDKHVLLVHGGRNEKQKPDAIPVKKNVGEADPEKNSPCILPA